MGYLDFIGELRTGKADLQKAEKAMKALGWLCIVGGLWNYFMYFIGPFRDAPFNLPEVYPYLALVSLGILGALFFRAARGIREMAPWGKRTGQLAIGLLVVLFFGLAFSANPLDVMPVRNDLLSFTFALFYVIAIGQFALPAYFGIRYLGCLPVKDDPYSSGRYRNMGATQAPLAPRPRERTASETTYKDSPFSFGVGGTFVLLLAVPLGLVAAAAGLGGLEYVAYAFPPVFLVVFCAPIAYNYVSSRFEDGRTRLASYTGGGSIFMFNASWPFFRLLVYEDGVEVRVEYHRFFIPYASMGELPIKAGFFTRGLLIASDLEGVPSKIRFGGFGMKRIVATVGEARAKWLANHGG